MEAVARSERSTRNHKHDDVIHDYEKMVHAIVRSYHPEESIFPDLVQEGILGLLKAHERFDESLGNRFSTYATYWVKYYVRRYLFRNARSVRIPLRKLELFKNITQLREEYVKGGIELSDEDLACAANISIRKLHSIEQCNQPVLSFDLQMGDSETRLYEVVEDSVNTPAEVRIVEDELRAKIKDALNELLEKEQLIIKRRFGFGYNEQHTLREIAVEYGVSAETVRQIEKRAIAKLRERCADLGEYLG